MKIITSNVKKCLTLAVILLFISVSVIPSTRTTNVKQSGLATLDGNTLYVGGNGTGNYTRIQDAIDNASDGDTVFVYNGTYYENIIVDISIKLVGESKKKTIIDGSSVEKDIISISCDFVTIINFTMQNSLINRHGIYINSSNNITIKNCLLYNIGYYGFELDTVQNCVIFSTEIHECGTGIHLIYSTNNTISNNTIYDIGNQGIGVYADSNNNLFSHNYISDCNGVAIAITHSYHNHIVNNNISNNNRNAMELILYSNYNIITGNNIISNEDDGIKLRESDFNIITGNNISENWGDGIYITDSYKNNLSLNTINNNAYGIRLSESLNGSVFKNTILHNRYSGIVIGLSSNIIIEKNAISESFYDDYNGEGIVLIDSWNISISYNYLSDNINGILIINSSWNHIFHNIITNNSHRGIYFWPFPSHYNMIERNNITNNNCGVLLKDSSYNEIIYNNFNGNKKHAKFVGCRNAWNSNYWGRIRLLPKPIFGRLGMHGLAYNIPWVQFDWHPAQEPYDI